MQRDTAAAIQIEERTGAAELAGLAGEWLALWKSCPSATPFQAPGWLIPWVKFFGNNQLRALSLRQDGQLVALAIFFTFKPEHCASRELVLAGSGISDYLDILAQPGFERRAVAEFFGWLKRNQELWEICDFQELRSGSALLEVEPPIGWLEEKTAQSICLVLDLPKRLEDMATVVPKRMLEKLEYYRRRIGKSGEVQMETATQENFGRLFDALIALHSRRWNQNGQSGVLAESMLQNFHHEAADQFLRCGALRLYGLLLNGRVVAALYGFRSGRRLFYYLGGFDPELSQLSPGTVLIGHAIEQSIREGAGEFDFLRGQEKYKYAWGAKDQLNYRRRLWRNGDVG